MDWWETLIGVGVAVGGAAVLGKIIYDVVDEVECEARGSWEQKRLEVSTSVEKHTEDIKRHIQNAQSSYDFYSLIDLHYSSFSVADQAYALLQDARSSLIGLGKMLRKAKEEKQRLQREFEEAKAENSRSRSADILERLKLVNSMRKNLFDDRNKVRSQKEGFFAEVRRLNSQTFNLKETIRDRCGAKGSEWYRKLEMRRMQRRESLAWN